MKKIMSNRIKNVRYILGYWAIFVIIPFFIAIVSMNYLTNHYIKYLDRLPAFIMIYVLFIAPFLYFIPYRIVKPKAKTAFIIWGIVVPYLFIYLFIDILVFKNSYVPKFIIYGDNCLPESREA